MLATAQAIKASLNIYEIRGTDREFMNFICSEFGLAFVRRRVLG